MLCPKCGDQFVPGIKECVDCNVPLVEELPKEPEKHAEGEPEYVELVTVMSVRDLGELLIAKSLLESEGIRYLAKGEGLQSLFGYGSIGAGFNFVTGPIKIQVSVADEGDAKAILNDLMNQE